MTFAEIGEIFKITFVKLFKYLTEKLEYTICLILYMYNKQINTILAK